MFEPYEIHLFSNKYDSMMHFLLINSTLVEYFKSEKRLRQRDSISPLLFILVVKHLSRGLNALYEHCPSFYFIQGTPCPLVT
ncbi:Uncharacterized protein TCM_032937 [Theobroma cacao]|uniref:Reverse transcriptase domain-containing protein n=1 Tax=Theobroma cacao TaxID=3641 RepID=A0A061FAB5_THECC|nr:Uncharacterized protein TCM_032937 [Theobroma cacao]